MAHDPGGASVVLIGAHGHGREHLRRLGSLARAGRIRLAGVADVRRPDRAQLGLDAETAVSTDGAELIDRLRPAVVVISTPVHTHAELAATAFAAGAHVLLEKPPTPTLAGFERLLAAQRAAGVACQIGLQSFGSAAVAALFDLVRSGALGELVRVGAAGTWSRDEAYYARSAWAGRRQLDGVPVMDGALTNPFAHAVAVALAVDGAAVHEVELETYRAYPIEADDTACARIVSTAGTPVTIAVTLCAAQSREPYVDVVGTAGRARLWYTEDRLRTPAGERQYARVGLLENLLDHLADPRVALLAPLAGGRALMQVVEAVRRSPAARPIPERDQQVAGVPPGRRRVVTGIDELVPKAAEEGRGFAELGAPWAAAEPFRWRAS
jgi:predicted dehydrogenase